MTKQNKGKIIVITVLILALAILCMFLFVRNMEYKSALQRDVSIKGTYQNASSDSFITITIDESTMEYCYYNANTQKAQKGKIEKYSDNYYIFYKDKTDSIFGKIIPSYNSIYFIGKNSDINHIDKISDDLIYLDENF